MLSNTLQVFKCEHQGDISTIFKTRNKHPHSKSRWLEYEGDWRGKERLGDSLKAS